MIDRCPNCGEPQRNGWCYRCIVTSAGVRAIAGRLDIVDLSAIAERAGTTRGTVASWRNRHPDFPAPLVTLAIGPIWIWHDVDRWLSSRKKGR